MNKVQESGRLTKDPEVRYSQGEKSTAVARFTLAVDRRFKREGEPQADFIPCVAFGKTAEFIEKYFRKGMKVIVCGRLQSGSYEKEGQKFYTLDIVVDEVEFADSKRQDEQSPTPAPPNSEGFMNIPDGIDEEFPFN